MKTVFRILVLDICIFATASVSVAQWVRVLNTAPNGVMSLAYDGTNLFAGTISTVHVSTDQGAMWVARNIGTSLPAAVFCIATSGTNIFAGHYGAGVWRSTNNGTTWTEINSGIPTPADIRSIVTLGTSIFASATNYSTGRSLGVYRSTNNGSNWTSVNTGLTNDFAAGLFVSGTDLFAGGASGTVFLSTNSGSNWTQVGNTWVSYSIGGFAMCGNGLFAAASNGGVFRSTDRGGSWSQVTSGLTDWNFYGLTGCGAILFAGTKKGVFLSTNNGASWDLANTGLTDKTAGPFVITATHIFAATETGVWKRPLSDFAAVTAVQNNVPCEFKLEQNYPNPFNPATSFEFRVPSSGFVSMKVFDVLGKEVATLVNGECQAGSRTVRWDASGLPSGVYACRLKAGTFTQTQKVVLAK